MGLRLAEGIDPRALRRASPAARSIRTRIAALRERRPGRDDRRRPPARDAWRAFRCSMRWWPISRRDQDVIASDAPASKVPPLRRASSDRGAEAARWRRMTCAPEDVTRSTASPRWLVPSGRKRNTPSMPAKPDGLVSISWREALRPLRLHQRGDERDRVIGERRGAHRVLSVARAVAAGEIAEAGRIRRREPAALAAPASAKMRGSSHSPVPSSWTRLVLTPLAASVCTTAGTASAPSGMKIASALRRRLRDVAAPAPASRPVERIALDRDHAAAAARDHPAGTPPPPRCHRHCPGSSAANERLPCRGGVADDARRRRTPAGSSADRRRAPRRWSRSRMRSPARRARARPGRPALTDCANSGPRMISAPSSSACCAACCAPRRGAAVVLHQKLDIGMAAPVSGRRPPSARPSPRCAHSGNVPRLAR